MAVLLWGGSRLYFFPTNVRDPDSFPLSNDLGSTVAVIDREFADGLSPSLLERLRRIPAKTLAVSPEGLAEQLHRVGLPTSRPSLTEFRSLRERLPRASLAEERGLCLALAESRLVRVLTSPEEVLISFAREEERVERALGREIGAAAQWVPGGARGLTGYQEDSARFRKEFERHHERLVRSLELAATSTVPNLARVVGARVAARLVAAAGGVGALSRMTSSRLQLLGSRHRPSARRGPRFGLLYRAFGMTAVPLDRQGAYARSLASLAVIAARADATTRSDLSESLVARRDRRIQQLQRSRA